MFERTKKAVPEVMAAKWSVEIANEGFVPLPKRLLRCMRDLFTGSLGVHELTAILAIIDNRWPGAPRPPSLEYLSFTAGMVVDEFLEHVRRMEERGWIETSGTDADYKVSTDGLFQEILKIAPDED